MQGYPIAFEVRGPLGMFADPASGSEAISYPLPPASACQGMIESIVRILGVNVHVVAVATCHDPKWNRYTTNSFTEQRKGDLKQKNAALQIRESFLLSPCFHILAILARDYGAVVPNRWRDVNCAHSMQAQFYKRLRRGQSFQPVSLGRRELMADYVGRQVTPIQTDYTTVLPSMVVYSLAKGTICRDVRQNLPIKQGVLCFTDDEVTVRNGLLEFSDPNLNPQ